MGEPLLETRPHTASLAWPLIVAVLASLAFGGVLVGLRSFRSPGVATQALALVGALVALVAIGRLIGRVWEWDRTRFLVDRESVAVTRGRLRLHTEIVPFALIDRVQVRRTLAGRILGYGTIELGSRGRRSRLVFVPAPERISDLITAHARRVTP
jgi:membrane protein YdbS with pleckstrin-like domain